MGDGRGEASEPWRRAQQQGCREQSREIPTQRIGDDQHSPTWDAGLLTCRGGWGLRAEDQALEVRPQGEDWGWLREDSLKGATVTQLAGRESGKKSGTAKDARDHCFGMREERAFLPHVHTESRAPPKWAPEMGASHGYQLRTQRQVQTTNVAAATTKNPVCKHRSLPTPRQEPVQHTTARILWSRDNFPWRTHGATQDVAMSHRPVPPQAHPAFQLWLPYHSISPAWVSKRALISCYFNPLLSWQTTDVWGQPTCRGGAKTKAEPQELCELREEREISPCSLRSRLHPHKQLDKLCIRRIPEYTMNVPQIEAVDFGSDCRFGVCFLRLICFRFYV